MRIVHCAPGSCNHRSPCVYKHIALVGGPKPRGKTVAVAVAAAVMSVFFVVKWNCNHQHSDQFNQIICTCNLYLQTSNLKRQTKRHTNKRAAERNLHQRPSRKIFARLDQSLARLPLVGAWPTATNFQFYSAHWALDHSGNPVDPALFSASVRSKPN